jgi:microcystin-dependent protein
MATLYENLLGGSITNNPLTSGATTITSTAFQYLPTVTVPDVMFLTLDPEGLNGAPEIVQVTNHSPASTTVTVVRGQQDTAARSHPTATKWVHSLTEADVDEFLKAVLTENIVDGAVTLAKLASAVADRLPQAGDLKATVSTVEAGGWKNHNQTLIGAQTLYPALWAVAPASWKSGANLVIPNLSDVALIGAGTVAGLGAVAGSNTVTLTEANLPAHTHTGPSHTHTGPSHNHTTSAHTHTASSNSTGAHTHTTSGTTNSTGGHGHNIGDGAVLAFASAGGIGQFQLGSGWSSSGAYEATSTAADAGHHSHTTTGTAASAGAHTHTVTVDSGGGGSTGDSGTAATGAAGTGATGSTGSGSSFSIVARSLGVNVQVLAY